MYSRRVIHLLCGLLVLCIQVTLHLACVINLKIKSLSDPQPIIFNRLYLEIGTVIYFTNYL